MYNSWGLKELCHFVTEETEGPKGDVFQDWDEKTAHGFLYKSFCPNCFTYSLMDIVLNAIVQDALLKAELYPYKSPMLKFQRPM